MVENYYVRNGAVAGLAAGIVTAAIVYSNLPTVEEVLREASKISFIEQPLVVNEKLLGIVLKLSGVIACIFFVLIGLVFGGIHEYIDKKIGSKTVLSALITGLLLLAILTVPNILLGGSPQKTLSNSIAGLTYTIALIVLAKTWDPKTFREDILESSKIY